MHLLNHIAVSCCEYSAKNMHKGLKWSENIIDILFDLPSDHHKFVVKSENFVRGRECLVKLALELFESGKQSFTMVTR